MGGFGYDRQVFVKSKQAPPPPARTPLPGAFVLFLVAALGAFAAYRYIKAGGLSNTNGNNNAQVKQLQDKIAVLQTRINELEKERRLSVLRASAQGKHNANPQPKSPPVLSAQLAHRPVAQVSEPPVQKPPVAASSQPNARSATTPPAVAKPDPALSRLQGDFTANHQEWEATVNRLGNVVGELDAQQSAIKQNQTDVDQLLSITRRTGIPFSLKKQSRFQRVGPVSLKLTGTNVRNQRYTMRMIVNDKSVELKDRALNEVIQFYTTRSQYPVQLVVSHIKKGRVSGRLAVPNDLNSANQSYQMQAR